MDVQKKIKTELDTLTVTIAGAYNDLITDDIPDSVFDEAVEKVSEAKSYAEKNLIQLAQEIVEETTKAIEEAKKKKEARLNRLVPQDVEATVQPEVVAPVYEAPQLEGPQTPIPRDITDEAPEVHTPESMKQMAEVTEGLEEQAQGTSLAGLVDMDETITVDHDLGLTIAEENRMKAGLPVKLKRPKIRVTGTENLPKAQEAAPQQPAPVAPARGYESEMHQIGKICAKYATSSEGSTAMLAELILTIVEDATGENFTQPPKEE